MPDAQGGPVPDSVTLLRNGATFTTAQRAFVARLLAPPTLEALPEEIRCFLAVEAFEQYMVSTEDTLTWLYALSEWEIGGPPKRSLFARLDSIRIGSGKYAEARLLEEMANLTGAGLAVRLKIPKDYAPPPGVTASPKFLDYWVEGLHRIVKRRLGDDRLNVRVYNKAKHGLLGVRSVFPAGGSVAMITHRPGQPGYVLDRVFIQARPRDIQMRVNWTLQMQAVLQSILAAMLGIHFGEWINTPAWAKDALNTEGWLET